MTHSFMHLVIFLAGFLFACTIYMSLFVFMPNRKISNLAIAIFTGITSGVCWALFEIGSGELSLPVIISVSLGATFGFYVFLLFIRKKD
jgi:predicted neutral ceramidase superfamily lipid hydrolase